MNTKKYTMGTQLTAKYVEQCPKEQNIGVIVSNAEEVDTKYGKRIAVNININKLMLKWVLNPTSVKNMEKVSTETDDWLQTRVAFVVRDLEDGKKQVIGEPIL